MPSITFDLETVTPLFLSGADQNTAELRPPAFRGALRYWFRAIAGQYFLNNLPELKRIEASLFGDTQQGSSNIIIRLKDVPRDLRTQSIDLTRLGLSYLWFSTKAQRRENKPARQAIDAETRFSLTLSTHPNPKRIKQQQKNLLLAANSFWLAVNLGGFGTRERRGAGSLKVLSIQHNGLDEQFAKALPRFDIRFVPDQIPLFYRGELKKIQKIFSNVIGQEEPEIDTNQLPGFEMCKFPSLFTKIYRIEQPYQSWEDALDHIGQQYSAYRRSKTLQERRTFGLPLRGNNDRRPSPLRIKIVRSVNEYFCFLITSYSDFPIDSGIENIDDFKIVDDFIHGQEGIEEII